MNVEMNIKEFIKLELQGWTKQEIIGLSIVIIIILMNAFLLTDSPLALMSAFCGIMYTIIAGKGKISCYLFGLLGSSCYGYLSLKSALYGNLLLYMGYYIPMQILGIFQSKKNLNKKTNEILKTKLPKKELLILSIFTIFLCLVSIIVLKYYHDGKPYIDGITTILSILGMYLTVKRCIEQWIIWAIVNGLSIIMWTNIVLHGAKTYSTILMWSVYFILSIYFFFKWKSEMLKKA